MATKYESYEDTMQAYSSAYGVHWKGQTFTPQISHTITSIFLYLEKVDTPGDLVVSIRATSGGVPTGGDLTSGTLVEAAIPASFGWASLGVTAYALTAGVMYAICWRATAGTSTSDCIRHGMDTPGLYTRGTYIDSDDSGANWYDYGAQYDALFQDWGTAIVGFPHSKAHLIS